MVGQSMPFTIGTLLLLKSTMGSDAMIAMYAKLRLLAKPRISSTVYVIMEMPSDFPKTDLDVKVLLCRKTYDVETDTKIIPLQLFLALI